MESTREKILNAALDEFAEKGYEAATTRAIADRAGFREITLFRHFGSKRNLLKALLDQKSVAPSVVQLFERAYEIPMEEILHELGRRFYTQLLSREKMVRLLILESQSHLEMRGQLAMIPTVIHEQLQNYLADLMKQGKIKKGDPYLLALAFLSMFFSLVIGKGFLSIEGRSPEEVARVFVDVFLSGVKT